MLCVCTRTTRTGALLDAANPYVKGSAENYQDSLSLLMKAMDELDSSKHMSSGLNRSAWKRFCRARRNKIKSEELVCKILYFACILLDVFEFLAVVEFSHRVKVVVK